MTMNRVSLGLLFGAAAGAVLLFASTMIPSDAVAAGETRWFASFEGISVAPVRRSDVTQLIDAGTISTDGFENIVFSLGGEFKERLPEEGTIGALLIPDEELFDYLLRNEGHFVFPLEVKADMRGLQTSIFISESQTAKVAFPAYRIYLYNETTSAATVSLYVYRSR